MAAGQEGGLVRVNGQTVDRSKCDTTAFSLVMCLRNTPQKIMPLRCCTQMQYDIAQSKTLEEQSTACATLEPINILSPVH